MQEIARKSEVLLQKKQENLKIQKSNFAKNQSDLSSEGKFFIKITTELNNVPKYYLGSASKG